MKKRISSILCIWAIYKVSILKYTSQNKDVHITNTKYMLHNHWLTRPEISFKTDTETFWRPNIFEINTETFFRQNVFKTNTDTFLRTNIFETNTETFFRDQIFWNSFLRLNFSRQRLRLFWDYIFLDRDCKYLKQIINKSNDFFSRQAELGLRLILESTRHRRISG